MRRTISRNIKYSSVVNPLLFRQFFTSHRSTSQKAHNNIPYYLMLLGSITTIAAANIMDSNALIESEKTQLRRHYENKSLDELVSELRKIPGFENFSAFELYDFTTRGNDYCGEPEKETQWHKKQEQILESHPAYSVFHMKYYLHALEMQNKEIKNIVELSTKLENLPSFSQKVYVCDMHRNTYIGSAESLDDALRKVIMSDIKNNPARCYRVYEGVYSATNSLSKNKELWFGDSWNLGQYCRENPSSDYRKVNEDLATFNASRLFGMPVKLIPTGMPEEYFVKPNHKN